MSDQRGGFAARRTKRRAGPRDHDEVRAHNSPAAGAGGQPHHADGAGAAGTWEQQAQTLSDPSRGRAISQVASHDLREMHTTVQLARQYAPTVSGLATEALCVLLQHEYTQAYVGHNQTDPGGVVKALIQQPKSMFRDPRYAGDAKTAVEQLVARLGLPASGGRPDQDRESAILHGQMTVGQWRQVYALLQPTSAFNTKVEAAKAHLGSGGTFTVGDILRTPQLQHDKLSDTERWFVSQCLNKSTASADAMSAAVASKRNKTLRTITPLVDALQDMEPADGNQYVLLKVPATGNAEMYLPHGAGFVAVQVRAHAPCAWMQHAFCVGTHLGASFLD